MHAQSAPPEKSTSSTIAWHHHNRGSFAQLLVPAFKCMEVVLLPRPDFDIVDMQQATGGNTLGGVVL